jgi:hypothetical protein
VPQAAGLERGSDALIWDRLNLACDRTQLFDRFRVQPLVEKNKGSDRFPVTFFRFLGPEISNVL